jgi:hypothetical protein
MSTVRGAPFRGETAPNQTITRKSASARFEGFFNDQAITEMSAKLLVRLQPDLAENGGQGLGQYSPKTGHSFQKFN